MPPPLLLLLLQEEQRKATQRLAAHFGVVSIPRDPNQHELFAALSPFLERLTREDVEKLGLDARELPRILLSATSAQRHRILRQWRKGPASDPAFAESILRSFGRELERHEGWKAELIEVILPIALSEAEKGDYGSTSLRALIVSQSPGLLKLHPALARAHRNDIAREKAAEEERERRRLADEAHERDRQMRATALRNARMDEISALPLLRRVELLISGNIGLDGPYPDSWADIAPDELHSLSSEARLDLIRMLRGKRRRILRRIRTSLKQVDRSLEAEQRKAFSEHLDALSLVEQFENLASADVPLRLYPISLAQRGIEHIAELPAALRQNLQIRLAGQRGAWGVLRKALRAADK